MNPLKIHLKSMDLNKAVTCLHGLMLKLHMTMIHQSKEISTVQNTQKDAKVELCNACMMEIIISFHNTWQN